VAVNPDIRLSELSSGASSLSYGSVLSLYQSVEREEALSRVAKPRHYRTLYASSEEHREIAVRKLSHMTFLLPLLPRQYCICVSTKCTLRWPRPPTSPHKGRCTFIQNQHPSPGNNFNPNRMSPALTLSTIRLFFPISAELPMVIPGHT